MPRQIEMFGVQYDSREEVLFSFYINELINGGWIHSATYQPSSFVLTDDIKVVAYEAKQYNNNPKEVKLLQGAQYTADWEIVWSQKAHGVFYWKQGGVYPPGFYPYRKNKANRFIPFFANNSMSYVDIKGSFSNAPGMAKFSLTQKWLACAQDVFVQKVIVSNCDKSIFKKTFTPRRVITDEVYQKDGKGYKKGDSKLKYSPVLLEQFVKKRTDNAQ